MSVLCPTCGREYDVTLFQFGRTVDCECGRRVTLARRTEVEYSRAPRFIADAMLGRLARWLRLIGVDTAYEPHIDDRRLAERAELEDRIVLTRDALLPRRFKTARFLLIESEVISEQLVQVVEAYAIDWRASAFSRCTRCNERFEPLAREAAAGRVPVRVLLEQEHFVACAACGRAYWHGSHAQRIRDALIRTLGSERS